MRRTWRAAAGCVVIATGCGGGGRAEAGVAVPGLFRRDDVILIEAHNEIRAVSAGERLIFARTQSGVIAYDALFRTWLPPLAGLTAFVRAPTVLAADPTEDAVWLGIPQGVAYWRPRVDYATTAPLSGVATDIFFDRRDPGVGAYVVAGGSVWRVTRTGSAQPIPAGAAPPASQRMRSPTAADVFRRFPGLETTLPLLTRDDDLRQWRVSAGTYGPAGGDVWLGTDGRGLLRVDPSFLRAEPLAFGLTESGVGALALAADGVWSGGLGDVRSRGSLVFVGNDLQRWRWLDGPGTQPLRGARVHAIDVRERDAWIATSRGLFRLRLDDHREIDHWHAGRGLPSDEVTDVVAAGAVVWVGTTAGVARIEDGGASAIGPRTTVRALTASGDTLWLATTSGLLVVAPGENVARRLRIDDSRLGRGLRGIARTDSALIVATDDAQLIEIDLPSSTVRAPRAAPLASLLRVARVRADAETIWIAGEAGVVVIHRASGRSAVLAVGTALPAPATDVALHRGVAWIGTRLGLVRLRRQADGMPS